MNVFEQVEEFHKKYEFPIPEKVQLPASEVMVSRVKFLREELEELIDAYERRSLVDVIDAIEDLIYVAVGTGLYTGLSADALQECFDIVHAANMKKIKVVSAEESKRGVKYDVKKPEGWERPEPRLQRVIDKARRRGYEE
jgi:predicted HAD superfamily Cof-like phosphohydrolase